MTAEKLTSSRTCSFIIITIVYVLAALVGWLAYRWLSRGELSSYWCLFAADVVATVFVWIFGLVFKNVSVYDPYWSVLPPVMMTAWAVKWGVCNWTVCLLSLAVWVWGIRLTANWAYTFRNLDSEDWRYTKYRTEQKSFIFQIINFFGLNMMPTVVVFLAMMPGLSLITEPCDVNMLTCVGFVMCIAAAVIQLVADTQKHRFSKTHKGEICKVGLWKHGRHPNYFGEILMWWGVWVMFISCNGFSSHIWYVVGPVAMTCLFLFISIPLMEGRQLKNKPGYAEYRKETRMMI